MHQQSHLHNDVSHRLRMSSVQLFLAQCKILDVKYCIVLLNVYGTSSNKLVAQHKRIAYFDDFMKLMMSMPTVNAVYSKRQEIMSNT